jgi:adenylosuccinate lyase
MRENIERGLGLWASSSLLVALVEHGLERERAYRIVQRASVRASEERRPFRDVAAEDADVARLDPAALEACFDETHLLRNVATILQRLGRLERHEEPARVGG